MKRDKAADNKKLRAAIKRVEEELRIGAKILEWEIGDIWGHVGARLPEDNGIAVQMFRPPEEGNKSWLVRFDHSLNKLSGVGTIPREGVIYPAIFKTAPGCECSCALPCCHVRRAQSGR